MAAQDEVDRLYQLPLSEFTGARNALAKAAGKDGASLRQLAKPSVAAWAVNHVYWQHRDVYDSLVGAAEEMRQAHAAALSGRKADLRATGRAHEAAVEAALKAALRVLADAGQPATDSTKQAIATTLRALPSDEPPGRLTRTLQPGGFEMLAGINVSPSGGTRAPTSGRTPRREAAAITPSRAARERAATPAAKRASPKALARAKEAVTKATRALRAAEHAARREEFEAARAAREAEKASRSLGAAREALEAATRAAEEAEREAEAAERQREAAVRRAEQAEAILAAARRDAEEAQRALDDVR